MEKFFLGIDLGGTNTKLGLVDLAGRVVVSTQIETHSTSGPENWIERVTAVAKDWKKPLQGAGVGSPGPLDTRTGTILVTPNLVSFEGFGLRKALEAKLETQVIFENDANCAALAEFHFGKFRGTNDLVSITLGTGVGSGVIAGGKLLRGHRGLACELGHLAIDFKVGAEQLFDRGSLEAMVGANRSVQHFLAQNPSLPSDISVRTCLERGSKAEEPFVAYFESWTRALSVGLYNVLVLFNPKVVILSGGLSASWPLVSSKVFDFIKRSSYPEFMDGTSIEVSSLGENFGVLGAVAAYWDSSEVSI